jgi:hypothetical protein
MSATEAIFQVSARQYPWGALTKGSRKNNFTFLCADASCLAALQKLEIS